MNCRPSPIPLANGSIAPLPALRGNRIGRTGRALAVTRRCGTYLAGREQHGDPCYSRYDRLEDGLKRFAVSPTPDSTLADPRQIIAGLRRELDECRAERDKAQRKLDERTTERDEAIAQQAATAEVLRVINSSPGDLTPVFDAMLEKATRLCGAPFGVLRTWDGERFHIAAANGDVKFTEWVRNYGPFAPAHDSSPAGRIVRGEDIVRFADAPGDEAISISPGFRALVEGSGMRSGVVVALRKDNTLLGNMTVYRQEVRPFTDKQTALLQNFAAQAVIAMENARLLGELRGRTRD